MLASICPLGERARGQRWGITVTAYVVASTFAGAAVGVAAGAAGAACFGIVHMNDARIALGAFALLGTVGLAFDASRGRLRLPGPHRQVNEDWLGRYRGWVYGAGFGAQLGAAFTTIVMVSAVYLAFAVAFLSASIVAGASLGAAFGFVRAAPLLLTARVHDGASLRHLVASSQRALRFVHRSVLVTQTLAVTVAVALLALGATA